MRKRQSQGYQALLGTVVKIALHPAARRITGRNDPDAGGADLVQPDQELGVETVVLQPEAGGGTHRIEHGGLLKQGTVVDQSANPPSGPLYRGNRPARVFWRKRDGSAVGGPVTL